MIIGVPLVAVIYDICKKLCSHILKKRGKYDLIVKYKKEFGKHSSSSANQTESDKLGNKTDLVTSSSAENETSTAEEPVAADTSSEIK
jgi:hypothetical protein